MDEVLEEWAALSTAAMFGWLAPTFEQEPLFDEEGYAVE